MTNLRTYISIILIILILGAIGWQSATVVHFYANQDEIEAEHCINKDKPELSCHGKCHLKAQLNIQITEEQPATQRVFSNSMIIFQGYEALLPISFNAQDKSNNQLTPAYFFSSKTNSQSGLLDPPEFS